MYTTNVPVIIFTSGALRAVNIIRTVTFQIKGIEQYFPVVQERRAQSTHAPVLSLKEPLHLCHYKEHIIIQ